MIAHDAFNERFALHLNTDGKPAQRRAAAQMTAVRVAPEWHNEASRLIREADPTDLIVDAVEEGRRYAGLLNVHRLTARELGLHPAKPQQPSLAEHFAARAAAGGDTA